MPLTAFIQISNVEIYFDMKEACVQVIQWSNKLGSFMTEWVVNLITDKCGWSYQKHIKACVCRDISNKVLLNIISNIDVILIQL